MKKNSLLLLTSLFTTDDSQYSLPLSSMEYLFPNITKSGKRSLCHVLEKKKYLYSHNVQEQVSLSATESGKALVKAQFPALNPEWDSWQGDWSILLFLKSPTTDEQFRNLRRILLQERAYPIKSGVYVSPGMFSARVVTIVESLYSGSVLIGSIQSWHFGFEPVSLFASLGIFGISDAYSGISKELNELLRLCLQNNRLSDAQKRRLFLVFDQYISNLLVDPGFIRYFFPRSIDPIKLLRLFQRLFLLADAV